MIVIIGSKLPTRIRGVLQLWLLEPKPHVFVGCVNANIEEKIIEFITPYLHNDSGITVIRDKKNIQGFELYSALSDTHSLVNNNGLTLYNHVIQTENKPS
jgi:CRISPR-associated endoribonuclease Cas2 subtype I-E